MPLPQLRRCRWPSLGVVAEDRKNRLATTLASWHMYVVSAWVRSLRCGFRRDGGCAALSGPRVRSPHHGRRGLAPASWDSSSQAEMPTVLRLPSRPPTLAAGFSLRFILMCVSFRLACFRVAGFPAEDGLAWLRGRELQVIRPDVERWGQPIHPSTGNPQRCG